MPREVPGFPGREAARGLRPSMDGRRRVWFGLTLLVSITLAGTLWYWFVERFGLVDGLYQAVTTISTVGFGEVERLGTRGRLFTIGLVVVGVGVAFYTLSGLVEELFEHQVTRWGRWRMDRRIETLKGHIVLCGFGRVGRAVIPLVQDRSAVVVVDLDADRCAAATDLGLLTVLGDATEDAVLERAGIRQAAILIVALHSDADAISTVLSARVLHPQLRIVARANSASSEAKLLRAGVDHVVNPLHLGATRLATFALQPAVADFMDVVSPDGPLEFRLEELVMPDGSSLDGVALADARIRESTGALLLAVREPGGAFESNPGPDTVLRVGVTLIAIGTGEQLESLQRLLANGERASPS
jgi:voltage-gated potassium channel